MPRDAQYMRALALACRLAPDGRPPEPHQEVVLIDEVMERAEERLEAAGVSLPPAHRWHELEAEGPSALVPRDALEQLVAALELVRDGARQLADLARAAERLHPVSLEVGELASQAEAMRAATHETHLCALRALESSDA